MAEWTHFDTQGRPNMVDVGGKPVSHRRAVARGWIDLPDAIFAKLAEGDTPLAKGDPFKVAELGGIMGAKKTPELIPLCHAIRLDGVHVRLELVREKKGVRVTAEARARDVTGVEMEALTAVSVAALVFYDMCKGIDKGMVIRDIRLVHKSGGKSGEWNAETEEL